MEIFYERKDEKKNDLEIRNHDNVFRQFKVWCENLCHFFFHKRMNSIVRKNGVFNSFFRWLADDVDDGCWPS